MRDRFLDGRERVAKNFSRTLEKAELPRFRVYDLRHTFASLLLAQGAPITYVALSSASTTLQWYAHWLPGGRERFRGRHRGAENATEGTCGQQAWAPIGHQKHFGRSRRLGSARNDWWAVKDSNLGPAD